MNVLNSKWLKKVCACPMDSAAESLEFQFVAVQNSHDEFLLEKLRRELSCGTSRRTASEINCVKMPRRIVPKEYTAGQIRQMIAQGTSLQEQGDALTEESLRGASNSWEAEPIINLVETLMEQALSQGATDIHLEPAENELRIRFRKDGLLEDYKQLPHWTADPILVRLKILADIDITDKRIPHDGGFTYSGLRDVASVRVSTLPVQGGEKCVLRLLPQKQDSGDAPKGLDFLNLSKKTTENLRRIFNNPQGLFLVTGPTGSGKTTTLHCGLQEIIQKKINVVTIEDPVEYILKGANQVQVNEKCGVTFAAALRSILRQDPDVILIGEIRDAETAQIAIRAAQTGHLVVATLHTNSAKAAFSRLQDLGIPQNLIEDSLLGIMAQRLLRLKRGGRIAVVELFLPNGTYVDGTLQESASNLVLRGTVTEDEVRRVLGNLYYIEHHEDF